MNRTTKILEILAESKRLAEERRCIDDDRLVDMLFACLNQSVQLFYSHPDYPEHLKPTLSNDFALLPTEIAHDVVESGSYEVCQKYNYGRIRKTQKRSLPLHNLSLIDGYWAQLGSEFVTKIDSFSNTCVRSDTDFDELKAKAPNLYEVLVIDTCPDSSSGILDLIGTRFTTICWLHREKLTDALSPLNFLKRHLKSKYLRTFKINPSIESQGLNDLFNQFVKRPQFKELEMGRPIQDPSDVFKEAHKSWEATNKFEVDRKQIKGRGSQETYEKLKEYFKPKLDNADEFWVKHTVHSTAKMLFRVSYNPYNGQWCVEMIFFKRIESDTESDESDDSDSDSEDFE